MRVLVTGVTGYVGARLAPRLRAAGHEVRGFARDPRRAEPGIPVLQGDVVSGAGLTEAMDGIDVAYFLIHSMEAAAGNGRFAALERAAAENFVAAAGAAGVRRIIYLGGILPANGEASAHLSSRVEVERILLAGTPEAVALRASIVIGARSRSFRFLVRLIERMPLLALPAWHSNRTAPIDERDMLSMLLAASENQAVAGQSLDIGGADVVSYGELIERIRELMLVGRPTLSFKRLTVTPIASRISAVIAGEQHELIGPLMEGLGSDLLARDDRAAELLDVRLHSLDAAIEHALGEWERVEPLAAR